MLEGLLNRLNTVPPVPPLKKQREPLQATDDGAVPPVPPVPSEKTKTQSKKQKILDWLAHIGETDLDIIEDTLTRSRNDPDARAYFLCRADEVPISQ